MKKIFITIITTIILCFVSCKTEFVVSYNVNVFGNSDTINIVFPQDGNIRMNSVSGKMVVKTSTDSIEDAMIERAIDRTDRHIIKK